MGVTAWATFIENPVNLSLAEKAGISFLSAIGPAMYHYVSTNYMGGVFDDDVWTRLSAFHIGLWGPSVFFFLVSRFGFMEDYYASYIEHEMSNAIWIIYFGGLVSLSYEAN